MEKLGKFGQQVRRARQINAVPPDLRSVVMVTASADGVLVDEGDGTSAVSEISVMPVDYSGKRIYRKPAKNGRGQVACRSDDGVKGNILIKGAKSPDGAEPTGDCTNCGLAGYPCRLTVYPRGAVAWKDADGEKHVKAGAVTVDSEVWLGAIEAKVTADLDAGDVRVWSVGTGAREYKNRKGEDDTYHYLTLEAGSTVDSTKPVLVRVMEKWPWTPSSAASGDAAEDDVFDDVDENDDPFDAFAGDDDDDDDEDEY